MKSKPKPLGAFELTLSRDELVRLRDELGDLQMYDLAKHVARKGKTLFDLHRAIDLELRKEPT